jgi:hypothetical protein
VLWNGVNITATFADQALEPDVEHICIAILILEGVASEIASANWDGLVEKAVERLTGGTPRSGRLRPTRRSARAGAQGPVVQIPRLRDQGQWG